MVDTGGTILARVEFLRAERNLSFAILAHEARRASARVGVDAIDTSGVVGALVPFAVVDVHFAAPSFEAIGAVAPAKDAI